VGCVGYVNAFNPHRIVIGGSIAEAEGERLLEQIRTTLRDEAFAAVTRNVTVVGPGLGGDVSLAGAHPLVTSRLTARSAAAVASSSSPSRSAEPVAAAPRR
jgi:glucokinase